jgi:hypothetical protein
MDRWTTKSAARFGFLVGRGSSIDTHHERSGGSARRASTPCTSRLDRLVAAVLDDDR